LIQQIDVMSSIASAFSDFAKMPKQRKEQLEVVSVVKTTLDVFEDEQIIFESNKDKIYLLMDKSQLIRVLTNLVKNAIQSVEAIEQSKIIVSIIDSKDIFELKVKDNGVGIEEGLKDLIFEPRFTTKNSGMGLGLAMSKKIIETYNGAISFVSSRDKGTVFSITIPKE
jgi:two-component system nitrogen regulation sensor histidine kinase NtrY